MLGSWNEELDMCPKDGDHREVNKKNCGLRLKSRASNVDSCLNVQEQPSKTPPAKRGEFVWTIIPLLMGCCGKFAIDSRICFRIGSGKIMDLTQLWLKDVSEQLCRSYKRYLPTLPTGLDAMQCN